jgi:hypothetical protein
MKRILHLTLLLAGMGLSATNAAHAATVVFSGSQSNTNAPGVPGGACPNFTVSIANVAPFFSTGNSNLGAFSTTQSHCLDSGPPLAPGSAPVPYYNGLFTYLFADGDTLFGDYSGTLANSGSPGIVSNSQLFDITGGTGEFAGASGSFTGSGVISFAAGRPPISNISFSGSFDAPGVPEPAAWGLMLIGFASVGTVLRRRAAVKAWASCQH